MKRNNMRKGVTLIELAVVLVIIGLLIGIAFKGFDLMKSSAIVTEANKIQKITSAVVTFKSVHKRLPGDGCATAEAPTELCSSGTPDGTLNGTTGVYTELQSFWDELYLAGLITTADRASEIGMGAQYTIENDISGGHKGIYLDLAAAPLNLLCELDHKYGDGINTASKQDSSYIASGTYAADDDCSADITDASASGNFLILKK